MTTHVLAKSKEKLFLFDSIEGDIRYLIILSDKNIALLGMAAFMFLYLDRENDCFDFLHFWMRNRATKTIDEVQGIKKGQWSRDFGAHMVLGGKKQNFLIDR